MLLRLQLLVIKEDGGREDQLHSFALMRVLVSGVSRWVEVRECIISLVHSLYMNIAVFSHAELSPVPFKHSQNAVNPHRPSVWGT